MAATKECPYCHKEIADEAILCKYCHNLLIGSNQDIESAAIAGRERARRNNAAHASSAVDKALGRRTSAPRVSEEDLTREFSAADIADYEEKTRAFSVPKQAAPARPSAASRPATPARQPGPQPKRPEPQPVKQPVRQPGPQPSNYYDDDRYYDDDEYYDDNDGYYDDNDGYYDDDYYDDTYSRGGRKQQSRNYNNDDRYYEDDYDNYDEDDEESRKKRKIFIITALITVSVLAVIALAIFIGYKLVGFAKSDSSSSSRTQKTSITTATKITSETTTTSKKEETTTTTKTSEVTTTEEPTQTQTQTYSETETETQTQPTQSETQPTQSESQQTQQTQQGGTDQAKVLSEVSVSLQSYNTSGIKSYEYRTEDAVAVYLYVFTNDDHAYSVAYFKDSGNSTIVQAW